ncbi:hypothetical protein [Kurthia massiliensis]|uniref:hypothetical protein n=1 Tax=Kurthia massiliensis TaxID=1033739 RepID=UPI0011CB1F89|nr:hypothetical protein [Kurthia massiliensis]
MHLILQFVVLLASSLLLTTLGATTITNEVSVKENVKATTSAGVKKRTKFHNQIEKNEYWLR